MKRTMSRQPTSQQVKMRSKRTIVWWTGIAMIWLTLPFCVGIVYLAEMEARSGGMPGGAFLTGPLLIAAFGWAPAALGGLLLAFHAWTGPKEPVPTRSNGG